MYVSRQCQADRVKNPRNSLDRRLVGLHSRSRRFGDNVDADCSLSLLCFSFSVPQCEANGGAQVESGNQN
jgi:hypothetical protein